MKQWDFLLENNIVFRNLFISESTALKNIEYIEAKGLTSVGASLFLCYTQFDTEGNADYPDHVILLSDGKENALPSIINVLPILLEKGIIVHVVTIGADAAWPVMQALAALTGGMYFHLFDPASGDIPNDLAEIYRAITEKNRYLQRFYQRPRHRHHKGLSHH